MKPSAPGLAAQQWDKLLNASLNGSVLCQPQLAASGQIDDFTLVAMNQQAAADFARPASSLIGQSLRQLVTERDYSFLFRQLSQALATEEPLKFTTGFEEASLFAQAGVMLATVHDGCVLLAYSSVAAPTVADLRRQIDVLERIIHMAPCAIALHRTVFNEQNQIVDFQMVKVSDLGLEWLRVSGSDAYSKPLSVLFPGFERSEMFRYYVHVAQTGEPAHFERYIYNNWFDFSVARFDDSIIVTVTLTTERKKAELALKEQTETLEGILDAIPVGVFVSEAVRDAAEKITDFKVIEANAVALRTSRQTRSAMVGQLASVVFPPARFHSLFDSYTSVLDTREVRRFETTLVQEEHTRWLFTQLSYLGRDRVISSFSDVTPIRQAEQVTQQQRELLQKIVDNVQVGIGLLEAVRDAEGRIVDFRWLMANEADTRITRLTIEQKVGQQLTDLLPGTGPSGFLDHCINVVETGQPYHAEFQYNYDGIDGWFDLRIVKQGDGVLFSSSDITQRKLAELELERQNQILQRANRELIRTNDNLEQFAYIASHDLQEPLRKIQAFGDMLRDTHGPALPPDANDLIVRMQTAARRMALLIKDLLTYSRISTQPELVATVPLDKLFTEVIDNLYVAITESGAAIELSPLPVLTGDWMQLGQLFQNLLSNSIKFQQPGVTPLIRVQGETVAMSELPDAIRTRLRKPATGQVACIRVDDNGIGFGNQYAERIFQVFQRLHGRLHYTGSGIGLAICRRVVENHGGAIVAVSEVGKGSSFQVYLPIDQPGA